MLVKGEFVLLNGVADRGVVFWGLLFYIQYISEIGRRWTPRKKL